MKKKLILIALLAIMLIAAVNYVILAEGMSVYVACETGFVITNYRSAYGYQVIKITCPFMGYNPPFPGLDYFCGETNKCE